MNRPLRPAPKPTKSKKKKKTPTKAESEYMACVKQLNCVACGAFAPNDAHHVFHDRYGRTKAPHWHVIPLCKQCHQDGPESIHRAKKTWREKHGPDWGYIPQTQERVFAIFGIEVPKKYRWVEDDCLGKWF